MHDADELRHQHRFDKVVVGVARIFGHFIREHGTGVHVQDICPCCGLCDGVGLDAAEIATLQLFGEDLAAGGVDTFPDHAEGLVKADDCCFGFGFDDGSGHGVQSFLRRNWLVAQQVRHSRWPSLHSF